MRTKFRLWDNHNNKYFEPTYEAYAGRLEYVVMNQSGELGMVTMKGIAHESTFNDRFVVEWFTGLLDKNGTEIYEGDLVRGYTFGGDVYFDSEVKFKNGKFKTIVDGWQSNSAIGSWDIDLEVTGNIHTK